MRMRTSAAVAIGALALTALAVPAAQADGGYGDTAITKVTVNGGKNVVVGTSLVKKFTVSVTARDDSGIAAADISLHGPGFGYLDTSSTRCSGSTCTATFTVDPKVDLMYSNDYAGTWYVDAWVDAQDGDYIWTQKARSFKFQRAATQSVNASPEPVRKGKTLTVTGKLARASWDDFKYHGYTAQSVRLQFCKKGSKTYTTVKTVKTNSTGSLKTTVKASADGYWRYSFAGTATTPAATSAADFVDVK
ncbi:MULTISPECIES: calcium-binding protein [unclassified Streptomyces]|uniref:calcium-binding protein n=1 Tax=unclassified Streptomyces TaxID=2593676 RepID=UPI00225231A0|nr:MULTISPECIES: calcium-binding protein [unclassified Streptomyces]MCX5141978.1 calcium-binding protein [Streptomyces sp. NBC_00338]